MSGLADLLGQSPDMVRVRSQVERLLQHRTAARRFPPVLFRGETGTGKGLLARAIHERSARAGGPFLDLNCAAIPETLLEAELFGFARGAFTDARQAKAGLIQAAHGGTLFLDEIGLLPPTTQGKLLTAIEEQRVRRLGSTRAEPVNVWILAATSENLEAARSARRFREDLYHRLAVLTLFLPPLRDRGEDILLLARHFLQRACQDYGLSAKTLSPDACVALLGYSWPGNIRELANLMERVALLSDVSVVTASELGLPLVPQLEPVPGSSVDEPVPLRSAIDHLEHEQLLEALRQSRGNISRAAAQLGLPRNTLRYRIQKHGLRPAASGSRAGPPMERPEPVPPTPAPDGGIAPAPIHWERRCLSFLQAVVVPVTGQDLPLEFERALQRMIEKVQSFGGTVEEMAPKGLMAVFGYEHAEDAPRRAALAALAIQAAERTRRRTAGAPRAGIAIHAAPAMVVGTREAPKIDLASKREAWKVLEGLLAQVEPDTIVASEEAARFLERRFDLTSARAGGARSGRAYRLAGRERAAIALGGRILTRFVGRDNELALLQHRWASLARSSGQVVGLPGEPGIGKSRLLYELRRRLAGEELNCLYGECASYATDVPNFALQGLLKGFFRIEEQDEPGVLEEKVQATLQARGEHAEALVPAALALFDALPPEHPFRALELPEQRRGTRDAMARLLLGEGRRAPLLMIIEDLHWVDSETQATLDGIIEHLAGAQILLLVSYRPEYAHAWNRKSCYTQLPMTPLSRESAEELLDALLGKDSTLASLKELLIDRTQGNPFFLEEMVRTLVETKALSGEREAYRLQGAVAAVDAPDTVEAVVAARIDRLPPVEKNLLQVAAVIGQHVPYELLGAVAELPQDALQQSLAQLGASEFLHKSANLQESEYTFRHTLTQEVAYRGLPQERRRALHARIVEALETLHSQRLSDRANRLAHHAFRAEVWGKALRYLRLTVSGRHPSMDALPERGGVASAGALWWAGEYDRALKVTQQDLTVATDFGIFGFTAASRCQLGQIYHSVGDYPRGREFLRQAVKSLGGELTHERFGMAGLPSVYSRVWLAWSEAFCGNLGTAVAHAEEAVRIAEAAQQPYSLIIACFGVGEVTLVKGDLEKAITMLERGLGLVRTENLPLLFPFVASPLGLAYALSGRTDQALSLLEQAVNQAVALKLRAHQALRLVRLSEARLLAGQADEAARAAAEALKLAEQCGEQGNEGWALRALGEVSLHAEPPVADKAESYFRQGMAIAERLGMRPLLAHCSLGLGRLPHRAGMLGAASSEDVSRRLAAAVAMYHDMGLRFWVEQADQEMERLR